MVQNFNIAQIEVQEKDAKIILHFSLDIDEETVDTESIFISEVTPKEEATEQENAIVEEDTNNQGNTIIEKQDSKNSLMSTTITKPLIKAGLEVDGRDVIIDLPEIKVNTFYEINATTDLRSITNLPLATKFRRRIKVDSVVDSSVEVLSPANFEDIENVLEISLKEIMGKSRVLFNNYEIQIASEWGFYDILHTAKIIKKSSLNIRALEPSEEYYIRARAINDQGDHGNWSKKVEFTFSKNNKGKFDNEDDLPQFVQDLKIIATSDQGTTPEKFMVIFNKDLDPTSIDVNKMILLRKQV